MIDDKFRVRRRMAKTSFVSILVIIFVILGIVFFGSPAVAANLQAASAILITLIGSLTATIGHYNHMVYATDKDERRIQNAKPD